MNIIGIANNLVVAIIDIPPDYFDTNADSNPSIAWMVNIYQNVELFMEYDAVSDSFSKGTAYAEWIASIPVASPVVDPTEFLIDLGPFYDRFGEAKMSVLINPDPAIKAILQDVNIRKWVDLKRHDVALSLAYIGSIIPEVTPELQASILTTPVAYDENNVLKKLYF